MAKQISTVENFVCVPRYDKAADMVFNIFMNFYTLFYSNFLIVKGIGCG